MPDAHATALAQALATLDAQAEAEKRAEAACRRRARTLRRTVADIRRSCQELGIELVLDNSHRPGGHSDARRHS